MDVWENIILSAMLLVAGVLSMQSIFTLTWMLYAWNKPKARKNGRLLKASSPPRHSFTAIIPARHEEHVIKDTIGAVASINYPEHLKETLVICRFDDTETIAQAHEFIASLKNPNVRLLVVEGFPINKPKSLNFGLQFAKNEVIAVFDAEDEPHPDIYNLINRELEARPEVSVVQSGVALMNYKSTWFSALNCMEYFFWFKSGLHFFTKVGKAAPLGGNTVFFKKNEIEKIGGWDEECLTEDADIGIRLSAAGAKFAVIYDENLVTKEETPSTVMDFIKQRTRWNQGFLQIFFKRDWAALPRLRQKVTALYVLLSPLSQALLAIYLPISVILVLFLKAPVVYTLFSFVPILLFSLQMAITLAGIYEFTRVYKYPFPFVALARSAVVFMPYQMLLMYSAFRAAFRYILDYNSWEKTTHLNMHRLDMELSNAN